MCERQGDETRGQSREQLRRQTEGQTGGQVEERVDVVDRDDVVLRTVPRSVMRRERLRHRAVYVAVLSPRGRLLVHRRSEDKDVWPGWWDVAFGGVVAAGESWEGAARRELAEEIGIIDTEPVELGRGTYEDEAVAVVGRCYRVVAPGPFTFPDGEVTDAEWVDIGALDELIANRPFLPDSRALVLPLLR